MERETTFVCRRIKLPTVLDDLLDHFSDNVGLDRSFVVCRALEHYLLVSSLSIKREKNSPQSATLSPPCKKDSRFDLRFDEFWKVYPGTQGKQPTRAKWKTLRLDKKADEIIANVELRLKEDERWLDGVIPNPLTFINQRRWEEPPYKKHGQPPKPSKLTLFGEAIAKARFFQTALLPQDAEPFLEFKDWCALNNVTGNRIDEAWEEAKR